MSVIPPAIGPTSPLPKPKLLHKSPSFDCELDHLGEKLQELQLQGSDLFSKALSAIPTQQQDELHLSHRLKRKSEYEEGAGGKIPHLREKFRYAPYSIPVLIKQDET